LFFFNETDMDDQLSMLCFAVTAFVLFDYYSIIPLESEYQGDTSCPGSLESARAKVVQRAYVHHAEQRSRSSVWGV